MGCLPPTANRRSVLIIAQSGRMLAQAARQSGFTPLVIDCYGDQDTRQLAAVYQAAASLQSSDLQASLAHLKHCPVDALVYGSGFEHYPDSLAWLAAHYPLCGNSPTTLLALQHKPDFFKQLARLAIPHPAVRFEPPPNPQAWLIKPQQGLGGVGIYFANQTQPRPNHYFQHYIHGTPMSALFLANGRQAKIIGFNRQWTTTLDKQPMVFAGVINQALLPSYWQSELARWVEQLTAIYDLRGLNSLDFMYADKLGCAVLEINPRIPASMSLYNGELLTAHIQACRGQALAELPPTATCRALQIVYTEQAWRVPDAVHWPGWAHDIPAAHSLIAANQPVCSLSAGGKKPFQVITKLRQRRQWLAELC